MGSAPEQEIIHPLDVLNISLQSVALSWSHGCAVNAGRVRCWGSGGSGQLGNGENGNQNIPVDVVLSDDSEFSGVLQLSLRRHHACVVKFDGSVWCWGQGRFRPIGQWRR